MTNEEVDEMIQGLLDAILDNPVIAFRIIEDAKNLTDTHD